MNNVLNVLLPYSENFGGCGNLFVYACSRKWACYMWLIVLCIGVQEKYCCYEGICRAFGVWFMDKVRCIFLWSCYVEVSGGPAKSMWAGYLEKYPRSFLQMILV